MKIIYNPSFLGIKTYTEGKLKFIKEVSCRPINEDFLDVSLTPRKDDCEVVINNNESLRECAVGNFTISDKKKVLTANDMFTDYTFRHKGFGTCLHLINIIELNENNLDCIKLYSLANAMPFHRKFGFKPDSRWNHDLKVNLKAISEDCSLGMEQISENANALLKNHIYYPKLKASIGNKIIQAYLDLAIKIYNKDELGFLMPCNSDMILTKKDILKNKEFYNQLFKRFCFEYRI